MAVIMQTILSAALSATLPQVPPVVIARPGVDTRSFQGGPLDGLGFGDVVTPDGRTFKGLTPSQPGSSPINASDRAALSAFVQGHEDSTKPPLNRFLRKNAIFTGCKEQGRPCEITAANIRSPNIVSPTYLTE